MEDRERRRFRDFVALAIPAIWLSASPFLLIALEADLPIAVGAAVFAATFVHAAYLARPRPMDRRVFRPLMTGSLPLSAATIAPRLIAFVTNDTYIAVCVSVSILIVTVLVVRSQVLKVIGPPPKPPHVGEWPIVSGGPQDTRELGGPAGVAFAHTVYGAFLAELGLRLSTGALGILAAEFLVLVMLLATLAYGRFSKGINGLTTAAYLAQAGKKVVVLERRYVLGGAAVTEEVYPGFKFTVCSYVCSLLRPQIIRDLDLPSHGFEVIPQESSFLPLPDGRYLFYRGDEEDTFQAVAKFSRRDAEAMPKFGRLMARMAKFIAPTLTMTPPDVGSLNPSELRKLLVLNKQVQTLTEDELYTFARLMTMSAADYLDEWFETDVVKASLCSSGIIGTLLGPRSPGPAYVLMHHYMGEIDGAYRSRGYVRGEMGMVSDSIARAARLFGAEIRVNAEVRRILVRDGRAIGVELASGEKLHAKVIASGADPKRTFLKMIEKSDLPADFVRGIENFKIEGSSGKVNLALKEAPSFSCLPGNGVHLQGAISIGPSVDYIEKAYDDAKYGDYSHRPYVDMCVPSTLDPTLAPPGKHLMSCFIQYAPYTLRKGTWEERRDAFGDTVLDTLEEYIPNLRKIILHRQVLSPWDLEQMIGLTGGNIFHGELTPDQLLFLRPTAGWAQYRMPLKGLYLCGSGAHPGGGVMGAPGMNAARGILKEWALLRV